MKIVQFIRKVNDTVVSKDTTLFFFRIIVSAQLIIVHGLKKIGVGTGVPETVPNPFHFPDWFNDSFAISANLIFPLFIIVGFYTRIAAIPILAVTLSGYFVVHWNDPLLVSDVPFMYSLSFLLIAFSGAGKYSLDHYLRTKPL